MSYSSSRSKSSPENRASNAPSVLLSPRNLDASSGVRRGLSNVTTIASTPSRVGVVSISTNPPASFAFLTIRAKSSGFSSYSASGNEMLTPLPLLIVFGAVGPAGPPVGGSMGPLGGDMLSIANVRSSPSVWLNPATFVLPFLGLK